MASEGILSSLREAMVELILRWQPLTAWVYSTVTGSIAIGYGLDDRGVRIRDPVVSRIFTSAYCPY
jgi:hypothetical protein